jgi:BolA protein
VTVEQQIEDKLRTALTPRVVRVENESHQHNVPAGSETHFRVTLVADRFAALSRVQRHRLVYQLLAEELAGPVHALALHTYAPVEWGDREQAPESPPCHGGSGSE